MRALLVVSCKSIVIILNRDCIKHSNEFTGIHYLSV